MSIVNHSRRQHISGRRIDQILYGTRQRIHIQEADQLIAPTTEQSTYTTRTAMVWLVPAHLYGHLVIVVYGKVLRSPRSLHAYRALALLPCFDRVVYGLAYLVGLLEP
jgi:hypothetical protein